MTAAAIPAAGRLRAGASTSIYAVESGKLIHEQIVVDLRSQVYDKMQRLSFRFFDANSTGAIINRVTGDVQSVRAFVDGVIIQLVILVLSLFCYLVYMMRIDVGVTFACLATTPILWVVTVVFSRLVRPAYDRTRELIDQVVLTLAENIQGVHVVKGFGREREEIAKFGTAVEAVEDQQQQIFWKVSIFTPAIGLLTQVNVVILLAYGGWLVTQHRMPLGTGMVVFAGLLTQFASQVANLTNITNSVQQSLSGARRVFEVLDAPIDIQSPPDAVRLSRAIGRVEFDNVSFAYDASIPVLQEIRFAVEPGQCVAILGATGVWQKARPVVDRQALRSDGRQRAGRQAGSAHTRRGRPAPQYRLGLSGKLSVQQYDRCQHRLWEPQRHAQRNRTRGRIASRPRICSLRSCPHFGYESVLGEGGMNLSWGDSGKLPGDRPRHSARPGDSVARRPCRVDRPAHRARDPGGHAKRHAGTHHVRRGPPAQHAQARRHGARAGTGTHRPARHTRRAARLFSGHYKTAAAIQGIAGKLHPLLPLTP